QHSRPACLPDAADAGPAQSPHRRPAPRRSAGSPAARLPRRDARQRRSRRQRLAARTALHDPPRRYFSTEPAMKRSWNILAQQSGGALSVQDFERAAYRLVTEQVLSASERGSRVAYHLVEDHFEDFVAALAPLGVRLERNAHYRYLV